LFYPVSITARSYKKRLGQKS